MASDQALALLWIRSAIARHDAIQASEKWVFKDGILTASPAWDSVLTKETYQDFRVCEARSIYPRKNPIYPDLSRRPAFHLSDL
jgi:hypothetical protein